MPECSDVVDGVLPVTVNDGPDADPPAALACGECRTHSWYVDRRAHHHAEVVRAPVRDRLALVEHDPVDSDAALVEHVAVDADRVGTQVLERKCAQEDTSRTSPDRDSRHLHDEYLRDARAAASREAGTISSVGVVDRHRGAAGRSATRHRPVARAYVCAERGPQLE